MHKTFLSLSLSAAFLFILSSCGSSEYELQEKIVKVIDNTAVMVDVTDGHVTLSGFIYNESDTLGFAEKILNVKGVKSLENNIGFYEKEND